jgi:hypothetical protein
MECTPAVESLYGRAHPAVEDFNARLDAGRDARRAGVARTIFSPRKAMDILGAPSALGRRSFNE